MIMCHMIADTIDELIEMADDIGVARRHMQGRGHRIHFDICKAKRARAIKRGAIEVTSKELIHIIRAKQGDADQPGKGKHDNR